MDLLTSAHPKLMGRNIMKYKVILETSEEGNAVFVPGLPGCHSQGGTESEALQNIAEVIQEYLAVVAELTKNKTVKEIEVVEGRFCLS
jgi:predicted RNase H-like HicB family nuclease